VDSLSFGLLFLPLLGGYWFCQNFFYTNTIVEQYDGERLIFFAATFGALLLVPARFVAIYLSAKWPELIQFKQAYLPWDYAGTAALAAVLGPVLAVVFNFPFYVSDWTKLGLRAKLYQSILREHGDELEILLHHAQAESKSVMLTLKSGKVYVAIVAAAPADLSKRRKYIRITPQKSGLRDPETKRVLLPVDYGPQVADFAYPKDTKIPSSLDKVIHKDEIEIFSLYDEEIWKSFNPDKSAETF